MSELDKARRMAETILGTEDGGEVLSLGYELAELVVDHWTGQQADESEEQSAADGVVVAWVRPGNVGGEFMECVLNLREWDRENLNRMAPGRGGLVSQVSSANISAARNEVCNNFLELSDAPWLLFLDTDMTFEPDLVERLLEFADEDKAPIVGGLCFSLGITGELEPTLYDLTGTEERPEFIRYHRFPLDAMFQVFGTGAACLLIHRSALEKVRDYANPRGTRGFSEAFPWFQETDFYGRRMSEDITFCVRAGTVGLPVWVNTAVKLGHIKTFSLTYERYMAQQAMIEAQREAQRSGNLNEVGREQVAS